MFSFERSEFNLLVWDLNDMLFALSGQYSASIANMNNVDMNEISLFFGKIKDKAEWRMMNAIMKQISRLLMVIQYWFILWEMAHIIIKEISMKLT